MRCSVRLAFGAVTALTLAACAGGFGRIPPVMQSVSGTAAEQPQARSVPANFVRACPTVANPQIAHCLALMRVGSGVDKFGGYGPADLQSAYALPSATQGGGQTVAVVDAYDDPNVAKDLSKYRAFYGLTACNVHDGCFRKVNQKGGAKKFPPPNSGWAFEEALDVEVVSAVCPNCSILLVEANTPSPQNLAKAVDTAVRLGANVVSNSYVGYGLRGIGQGSHYDHPGTILTAAAGDQGYNVAEPAGFPTVVSVGGTKLLPAHNKRGWKESVWTLTGSGCEGRLPKPAWQTDAACKGRTMNDVAALADPTRGVAVYDTYESGGWTVGGGTSVGSPLVGAAYALAGNASSLNAAQSLYAPGASLWDIVDGNNGTCRRKYLCNARAGYDGPTGNGTLDGVSAL